MSRVRCEAIRWCDGKPCPYPAKYLAPYDSSAVCGTHARAFLRCIPIAEIEPIASGGAAETQP